VLTDLVVRNMVLIDELALGFGDGMTVLTGETGAGKTLLTQAVGLLAGGRAQPGLVRAARSDTALGLVNEHVLSLPARRARVQLIRYRPL